MWAVLSFLSFLDGTKRAYVPSMFDTTKPMDLALVAYLSDMSESEKLTAVLAAFGTLPEIVQEMADAQVGDITVLFG